MSKQTFFQGAIILILAGFITKILGFVNRIVMARILGPEGVGLYMMAFPILILVITLTRLGLPIAISKLVAEAQAQGERNRVKRILVVSLSLTGVLSVGWTILTLLGAKVISSWLLTDQRAYWPLVAITPIIPIVAISSVIKGYFQGMQNMRPSAYSQVIEQVVRISLVIFLAALLLPYGLEFAAAGAMISVVIGECAALIYLLTTFKYGRRKKSFPLRQGFFKQLQKGKETLFDLLRIGLPATGSGLIGSISWTLEPILVAQSLALAGVATAQATAQYGLLSGYAMPLVMLPMFITTALSISLVPAISEAQAYRRYALVEHRLNQALRLALLCGAPSTVIMFIFAEPLTRLVYKAPEAAPFLKLLAPFFLLLYFQSPLQATLQGLGLAKAAMMNSLYGAVVKMAAILILASQPSLGIHGAALAININVFLVTCLHFLSLVKVLHGFSIRLKDYFKVGLSMGIMALGGSSLYQSLAEHPALSLPLVLLISLLSTGGIYLFSLFALKVIGRQDVIRIPLIGPWIAPWLPKR